jgi:hypothetical protein
MSGTSKHPEQDPAEGSRSKVERQLQEQSERQADDRSEDEKNTGKQSDRRTKDGS